jgi:hypothetical protein
MHKSRHHHRTIEDLTTDVVAWSRAHFPANEIEAALSVLTTAVIHTGEIPSDRLLRSAAIGSRGRLERLQYYVGLLEIDWRDVIVAGEYEPVNLQVVRVRDLNSPIPTDTNEKG